MLKRVTTCLAAGQRLCRSLGLALLGITQGCGLFFLLFLGFWVWSAFPAGGDFLFGQKRKSPKKVALGSGADQSWAL